MYATPGTHAYILPWGLLHDETDRGPLWDPTLNLYSYTYELPHKPFDDSNEPSQLPIPNFHSKTPNLKNQIPTALPSDLANPPSNSNSSQGISRPILRASTRTPHAPLEWFLFRGHWGDKVYPLSDERQYRFAGQYHYVSGPIGPWAKNLARTKVCQSPGECTVRKWGEGGIAGSRVKLMRRWNEYGEDGKGEDYGLERDDEGVDTHELDWDKRE